MGFTPVQSPAPHSAGMARPARFPLRTRHIDEPAEPEDGLRLLVEGAWPRGARKDTLELEAWLRILAPSTALRRWFGQDPARWDDFRSRYFEELAANHAGLSRLRSYLVKGPVTFVYAAGDGEHNNAVALRDYILQASG
ncbi:protein of unknown function DUF488 [Pseudoxanthomonas suwonensis 11-1]|uniref:Uroporphyrin-III C-methyltransferase n=2 Tax=Pseudoxanthomonas suwonensis TaxID=314722 RepID=E6WXL7_PSEUU|nr:protein of unknown function DUF488 [Pseudoxanthomonas suwonensis 11-1]